MMFELHLRWTLQEGCLAETRKLMLTKTATKAPSAMRGSQLNPASTPHLMKEEVTFEYKKLFDFPDHFNS